MIPTESHELAELVADLTAVIDVVAPPTHREGVGVVGTFGAALAAFASAWVPSGDDRVAAIADHGVRVAAAGMALVEGDAVTARRLIAAEPSAAGAA